MVSLVSIDTNKKAKKDWMQALFGDLICRSVIKIKKQKKQRFYISRDSTCLP